LNISETEQRMKKYASDDIFLLCDERTLQTKDISSFLTEVFSVTEIQVKKPVYTWNTPNNPQITLCGNASLNGCEKGIKIVFTENKNDITVMFVITAKEITIAPFTPEFLLDIKNTEQRFNFTAGKGDLNGTLSGVLPVGKTKFEANGVYIRKKADWKITFSLNEFNAGDVLGVMLNALNISFPVQKLPDINVKNFKFSYTTPSPKAASEIYLTLTSGAFLGITDKLGVSDIGFEVRTWNEYSEFALFGKIIFGKKALPVYARFQDNVIVLGADTVKEPVILPSFSEIAAIAGLDLKNIFPRAFEDITILHFSLNLPRTLDKVNALRVRASIKTDWTFFKNCTLKKVEMGFEYHSAAENKPSVYAYIDGVLEIASCVFSVGYEIEPNRLHAQWTAQAGMELTLSKILAALGAHDIPGIIDKIGIDKISLTFNFDAKVINAVIASRGFGEINAEIGDNDFSVSFSLNEIKLSSLPVAGTYLKLLDNVSMKELKLTVSRGSAVLKGNIYGSNFELDLIPKKEKGQFTASPNVKWININKSFGILSFKRLGAGYFEERIHILLDASLETSPVSLSLIGFGIGVNLSNLADISFNLDGMGLGFQSGAVVMKGEFLKSNTNNTEEYTGRVSIKVNDISLFAVGSYSGDSIFVYALLGIPLGGPPVFFITGLAAGFGCNEQLIVPAIDKVAEFPLVAGALGNVSEKDMVIKLKTAITRANGEYFLSAGVRFTSFKLIESFALINIIFGRQLEIAVLGLSTLNIPFSAKEKPLAHAQLAIKIRFVPEEGVFSVQGQLTSESYILSKDCKLTGGFALFTWFDGVHKGDFIMTLGGYHYKFKKPEHYPDVPRIGFNWKVSSNITISGQAYFALTPSVLMAGGRLEAVYKSGNLKAWFIANADFYIQWAPLFYDAEISVSLGASYRVDFLFIHHTFSIELGADLHVWGPEFSGTVHISWFIISFTVSFGADAPQKPKSLSWTEFKNTFIPVSKDKPVYTAITITDGLTAENAKFSIVKPENLEIMIKTTIPNSSITLNGVSCAVSEQLNILPMNQSLNAVCDINVKKDGKVIVLEFEEVREAAPHALWGHSSNPQAGTINALTGLKIRPKEINYPVFPAGSAIDLKELSIYAEIKRGFNLCVPKPLAKDPPQADTLIKFKNTAMDKNVIKTRSAFLESIGQFEHDIDISALAEDAQSLFDEDICLGVFA